MKIQHHEDYLADSNWRTAASNNKLCQMATNVAWQQPEIGTSLKLCEESFSHDYDCNDYEKTNEWIYLNRELYQSNSATSRFQSLRVKFSGKTPFCFVVSLTPINQPSSWKSKDNENILLIKKSFYCKLNCFIAALTTCPNLKTTLRFKSKILISD